MDKASIIKALRDTAQSASNAIAGNVSGPVDLIAAGLRGVGLPIPQNAVGGSQWMAERGLIRDVEMGAPRIVGETLGMAGPALVANFAPQIASALNQGAANLAAPRTLNPQTGAIVWHGSPHKYDKFDSSKIGTGEGAQAYGHGLYLAQEPDVSKTYMRTQINNAPELEQMALRAGASKDAANTIAQWYHNTKGRGGIDAALNILREPHPVPTMQQYRNKILSEEPALRKAWDSFTDPGYLYKVDLPDEQIAKMLDWDKPLRESKYANELADMYAEAGNVKHYVGVDGNKRLMVTIGREQKSFTSPTDAKNYVLDNLNQSDVYGAVQAKHGPEKASDLFKQQGIPGIRYLDGGSRGAGAGTSNFVVFPGNENMLKILERNGQPLGLMGVKPQNVAAGGGQMGAVYPRQKALETAQRNAAKPISEGGLGLPANNTPMDRARAMGFDTDAYHGTADDRLVRSRQFKDEMLGKNTRVSDAKKGHFTASTGDAASEYTYRDGDMTGNVLPLLLRGDRNVHNIPGEWIPGSYDQAIDAARISGKDGITITGATTLGKPSDVHVTFNPANIRSRFAAFDPARINEKDLLGRADPRLLGLLGLGTAGGVGAYNYLQGK